MVGSGNGWDDGYYIVPVAGAAVAVTPDGSTTYRIRNTGGHSETFTITNTGTVTATFSLSCIGTATVTCSGTNPDSVNLAPTAVTTATASFSVGAVGTGSLKLIAAGGGATDTGTFVVQVIPRAAAMRPELTDRQHFASTAGSQRFFVKNLQPITATYNLSPVCAGTASGCGVTPTSISVPPGESRVASVTYTVGLAGTTGSAMLRAIDATSSSLRDSGSVALSAVGAPFPVVSVLDGNPGITIERDLCLTIAAGSAAAFECGDLRIVHALPVIRTLNKARVPTLLYNSATADPYPIVAASVTLASGSPLPDSVEAVLKVGSVTHALGRWAGADWAPGATRRIALAAPTLVDTTALADTVQVVDYTLEVATIYPGSRNGTVVTGKLIVVNRRRSSFGAGWWLAGLERVWRLSDNSRLWVGGDGSARVYAPAGTDVWVAPTVDRPDTLKRIGTTFVRRLPGGTTVVLDTLSGRHTRTINRLSDTTSFVYTSSRLTSITLPSRGGGQVYTFAHDENNQFWSVTAPGGRITTVWVSSQRTDSIRDPDTTRVRFSYESPSSRRIVTRTDRRGTVTSYSYDAAKKLWRAHIGLQPDSIRLGFRTLDVIGLASATPKTATDTANVYTSFFGARHFASGANYIAQETKFWVDQYGALRRIVDPLSQETLVRREDGQYAGLATELQAANGFVTRAGYDARGNIVRSTAVNPLGDGQDAVMRYHWDAKWDLADSAITAMGVVTTVAYDAANGNRRWQQVGSDSARRVTFRYGNALGSLSSTVLPGTAADSVEYDGLGNVAAIMTPRGFWTTLYKDPLGRDTLVVSPVDSLDKSRGEPNTARLRQRTVYDVTGQDTLAQTIGPAMSGVLEQTVTVRKTFDAEGNLLSLTRQSSPDPALIGAVTTTWRYDSAGQQRVEVAPDGRIDSTVFDPAGSAVAVRVRRDSTITMRYDALDRLVQRIVPAVSYPSRTEGIATFTQRSPLNRPYPYHPNDGANGYTLARDSATFAYNSIGGVTRADNEDAWVRRDYYPSGLLKAETLYVRTVAALGDGGSMTLHKYVTTYRYDLDGRRTVVKYPTQLAPAGSDSLRFTYDPQTGALSQVWDALGNVFTHEFNLRGELNALYRNGASDARTYDADGNLLSHVVADNLRNTVFRYDARGKVLYSANAVGAQDTLRANYAGLGPVTTTQFISHFVNQLNCIVRTVTTDTARSDGLANGHYTNHRMSLTSEQCSTSSSQFGPRTQGYHPGTGRWANAVYDDGLTHDTARHDPAGNTEFAWQSGYSSVTKRLEDRASYYAMDGTLRAADYRTLDSPVLDEAPIRFVFEEYRYDALGRRVWVRARRECDRFVWQVDWDECRWDLVRRTVWDGMQELVEIQMPGSDATPVDTLENDTAPVRRALTAGLLDENLFFGRVLYTNGLGVDQPLSLVRLKYSSATDANGNPRAWTLWDSVSILPRWNSRGEADGGAFGVGAAQCKTVEGIQRCVVVMWPFGWNPYLRQQYVPGFWHGTLIEDKRDKAATLFRRNRVYDPNTGRFTQEDPIGLAGGLNLYGFANGDPVNFSDPFGLSADCKGLGFWAWIKCFAAYEWRGFQAGSDPTRLDFNFDEEGQFGALVGRLSLTGAGAGRVTTGGRVPLRGPRPDAVARNLPQQLALGAARSGQGGTVIMRELADAPRLAASYGAGDWVKMQFVLRGTHGNITVHWFRNLTTGVNIEYKFSHIASAYR